MNLVRIEAGRMHFELPGSEKYYLFGILQLYPLVNSNHHCLSKNSPHLDQSLLEFVMRQERQRNRQRIDALLNSETWFETNDENCRLSVTRPQADWLLRVLNDLRIGSWIMLGKPGPRTVPTAVDEQTSSCLATMQICGYFQMALLKGLQTREDRK